MNQLVFIVEGITEEAFVKSLLGPYLSSKYGFPRVQVTRITTSPGHKGGFVNFQHLNRDVNLYLRRSRSFIVTTMVDFYRIPDNVPGYDRLPSVRDPYDKVALLEDAFATHFHNKHFVPYIQLHEFEALLFTNVDRFRDVFSPKKYNRDALDAIVREFPNPELIDDGVLTAPSYRLKRIVRHYNKVVHGVALTQAIGMHTMCKRCRHFDEWLERLATFAPAGRAY